MGAWSDVGAQPDPGTREDLGVGPEVAGCGILEAGPAPEPGYGRGQEEGRGLPWAWGPWGRVLPGGSAKTRGPRGLLRMESVEGQVHPESHARTGRGRWAGRRKGP